MQLRRALRIRAGQSIAFVGAGGKTGAIRRLVGELTPGAPRASQPAPAKPPGAGALAALPVLVTTTTRLGREQSHLADQHLIDPDPGELDQLPELLEGLRSVLVTGAEQEGKWTPPAEAVLNQLAERAGEHGAVLLIEADGARGRSLKAPAEHEPVIPGFVELVVPVAGLGALGEPVDSEAVHRPELVAAVLGVEATVPLGVEHLARLMASPEAGLKHVPSRAEVRALLTQVGEGRLAAGRQVAERLLAEAPAEQVRAAVLADLDADDPVEEVHGRVAGVVLAAGSSSRLGQPKQLIEWRGRALVAHAVAAALEGGLDPVVVVLGDRADQVRSVLTGEPVEFVENPNWQTGQSTSVHAGLRAVESRAEAAAFLLSDTPFVDAQLIRALVERQRRTLAPLVSPWAAGRRANPVLFDRAAYPQVFDVEGDVGGRVLFEQLQVGWVDWDDSIALDLDTPEDLQRLRELE